MRIDQIHERINFIADKEQSGYFTPAEIDIAIDTASMWLFNQFLEVYATSTESQEALSPFKDMEYVLTNSDGEFKVVSTNYMRLIGLKVSVLSANNIPTHSGVPIMDESELAFRLNSQLKKPTRQYPVGEEIGIGSYRLHPKEVHAGEIRFLRRPAKPVFAIDDEGNYDDVNSVQLEWGEQFIGKIILQTLVILGIHLDNNWLRENGMALPQSNV
ncbi:hypothetical protein ACFS6H_20200 [Terrimonas rubra]|uniref:Uncharacterized protein n=1 Tax=Terrimonas rubra TaxID=1035890 RepID=A0ABW6A9I7_9BACT